MSNYPTCPRANIRLCAAMVAMVISGGASAGDWNGLLQLSVASDDNVSLTDSNDIVASNESDNYIEVLGSASRYLTGNKDNGVRFIGTLFNREYDTEDGFDFTLLGAGLGYDRKLGDWNARFEANYEYLEFGGDTYEKILHVSAEGRHKFSKKTELRVRYRYSDINAPEDAFSNLEGDRHQLRVEGRFRSGKNRYRLSYTYEDNDRDDRTTMTTFSSSSPIRHILRANAKVPLNAKWETEFDVRYRDSRYKDDNVSGGMSTRRDDDRFRAKATLKYKLDSKTKLFADYNHFDNDSSIDTFTYKRNVASVGVEHFF